MEAIRKIFPQAKNIEPKAYLRTNWSNEEFSQHSYTCINVGGSPKDFAEIAKSIDYEKVLFAGEHTYFDFLACTHTAMISGIIAAEKIIGLYVRTLTDYCILMMLISTIY